MAKTCSDNYMEDIFLPEQGDMISVRDLVPVLPSVSNRQPERKRGRRPLRSKNDSESDDLSFKSSKKIRFQAIGLQYEERDDVMTTENSVEPPEVEVDVDFDSDANGNEDGEDEEEGITVSFLSRKLQAHQHRALMNQQQQQQLKQETTESCANLFNLSESATSIATIPSSSIEKDTNSLSTAEKKKKDDAALVLATLKKGRKQSG